MYEKVNPSHPDKVADRLAGAIVDLAYKREKNPKVAVEVLLGHGYVYVIIESSVSFRHEDIEPLVERICGKHTLRLLSVKQDIHLALNQKDELRCGDNGIFMGRVISQEETQLTYLAGEMYNLWPTDGKFIISRNKKNVPQLTICQSNFANSEKAALCSLIFDKLMPSSGWLNDNIIINPLGEWTGGSDVDAGATNRKLGSDMGRGVTGGGLHGKDLSKADVSINIMCHLLAQEYGMDVWASCAIGDKIVTFSTAHDEYQMKFADVVAGARAWLNEECGGSFEKFAEWGLIRP